MFRISVVLFLSGCALVQAGGFDNSGRPFDIIFGEGAALKLNYKYIQPDILLSVKSGQASGQVDVDNIVSPYEDAMLALRWQFHDSLHCAAQWEEPFRFQTAYPDDQLSYQADPADPQTQIPAPVHSNYASQSLTLACRGDLVFEHAFEAFRYSRLSLIAGPKYQFIEGSFSSDLSRYNEGAADNYRATLKGSGEWAYLAGIAYEIPELAFRLSVFFHNAIEHQLTGTASAPNANFTERIEQALRGKTLTPKSISLGLQTGLTDNWLLFLLLRWGEWSSVDEIDIEAGPLSQKLKMFTSDTLNYELGLGYRWNERVNLGVQLASYVELNEPPLPSGLDGVNLRNPQADRYTLAAGAVYALDSGLRISLGGAYTYIENGRFSDNAYTVLLERSHALTVSGAFEYRF